jgi:hypothetical protein
MKTENDLKECLSFISCQLSGPARRARQGATLARPAVTVARQTGAGAMEIARKLAEWLQERAPGPCTWTVFEKNLVARMLQDHDLPAQLAQFIPEDRVPVVRDVIENVLGLHPLSETLIRQISETIVHLAEIGHVILVGRAANVITRQMPNVFHVRIIAPLEERIQRVRAHTQLDRAAALKLVQREDAARRRYFRDYFKADAEDDLLYDLVVNTARLSQDDAARLIGEAVLSWAKRL